MDRLPVIVGVGGFASNVGKTTLMCELLLELPGWEAIKTTRGHYRSCGKDPHICCVSHLIGEAPVIRSGRDSTYEVGKDTGRYWDAGAANVHWVIGTDSQIKEGILAVLDRVKAVGVLVEGNSFSEYVPVDRFIMVLGDSSHSVKRSARRALNRATSIYDWRGIRSQSQELMKEVDPRLSILPIHTPDDLPTLVAEIRSTTS